MESALAPERCLARPGNHALAAKMRKSRKKNGTASVWGSACQTTLSALALTKAGQTSDLSPKFSKSKARERHTIVQYHP
jgi:hypothetical protein